MERISEGFCPCPYQEVTCNLLLSIHAREGSGVEEQLSEQTEGSWPFLILTSQKISQPWRMERKGTELTIYSKILGPYIRPQKDIQWNNYASNYSQLWL